MMVQPETKSNEINSKEDSTVPWDLRPKNKKKKKIIKTQKHVIKI